MQTETLRPEAAGLSQLDAEEYLKALQTLTVEVDRAMNALATRALPSFEDSIVKQKLSCSRLVELARRSNGCDALEPQEGPPLDAELADRIRVAATTLSNLNRSYSALLKHSGDTLRQFAGLFQSYTGPRQTISARQDHHRTWSCEF